MNHQPLSPATSNGTVPLPALDVQNLTVAYEQTVVLHTVSFVIPAGERVALVGPNGAGKSTLLKALVGLIRPTTGSIRVNGHLHTQCNDVAYVPQRAQVDWSFPVNVWDVVMLGRTAHIGLFRSPGRHDRDRVAHSLELVRMTDLARRQIGELSGGQQQRVFIARALAQDACVLLLDEPMTGLDVRAQQEVLHMIDAIHRDGVTVLVATHDLQQAANTRYYERVLLLNQSLIQGGQAHAVLTAEHLTAAYGGHLHRIETEQGILLVHDRH
ncbi:MAG: metal ABC transporter ATP-binding protein [Chloroflexaceae bacterium]|nr:metal ABC transporter ATP-binding protein [Chloroflexaceae bacterium]